MSSIVTKVVISVFIGAVGAIAAYFLANEHQNRAHENGPGRRAYQRRPSPSPPPTTRRSWYEDSDDDTDSKDTDSSSTLRKRIVNGDDAAETSKCGICLEHMDKLKAAGVVIHATLCGHLFCRRCIYQALIRTPLCPNCRAVCEPNSTHVVYI